VLFAASTGVGAVGDPVKEGDTIVLFVKVSVPAKVAIVPVVGKVIFVSPTLVNVVLNVPAVVNAPAVKILPPNVIVLPVLSTPVPPYCPAIGPLIAAVPSKSEPYILLGVCNFVVVLALPDKLPVTLPTTLPVTFPVKAAVTVLALKLPASSLLTKVFAVLLDVADAIALAIVVIVDELTPPILLDELDILETTNAVVATSVPFERSVGVGAMGVPVNFGDSSVLPYKVSVPDKVASVPVVGKVILVAAVLINVVLKLPEVIKSLAVVILPPKLIVLLPLFTPVPP
jgi:hypothetical protein